ncbi:hypothetical protein [Streptomyces sp. NPDC051561]|uniref:hypothetical protein n=1 Tax=Streptomyces sp. NPDC051561 TaxID=3365658 RepID=UPI0037B5052A
MRERRGEGVATWGLIVEFTAGMGERKRSEAFVLAQVEGSREEALAELERRARGFSPEHPRSPKRRRLFRDRDGFLLVIDGAMSTFNTRFTAAELIEDSAALRVVEPAPEPEPEPEPEPLAEPRPEPVVDPVPDVARYSDGVPVTPSWLGRTDLP